MNHFSFAFASLRKHHIASVCFFGDDLETWHDHIFLKQPVHCFSWSHIPQLCTVCNTLDMQQIFQSHPHQVQCKIWPNKWSVVGYVQTWQERQLWPQFQSLWEKATKTSVVLESLDLKLCKEFARGKETKQGLLILMTLHHAERPSHLIQTTGLPHNIQNIPAYHHHHQCDHLAQSPIKKTKIQ